MKTSFGVPSILCILLVQIAYAWKIKGLHHQGPKIMWLYYLSLLKKLNFFVEYYFQSQEIWKVLLKFLKISLNWIILNLNKFCISLAHFGNGRTWDIIVSSTVFLKLDGQIDFKDQKRTYFRLINCPLIPVLCDKDYIPL